MNPAGSGDGRVATARRSPRRRRFLRRPAGGLVTVLAAAVLVGCGNTPEPPPPAPLPSRSAADLAACERHTQTAALIRREAEAYGSMPVPAVRVALVLAATWEFYNASGAQDPVLVASMTEVAAAIGDLDTQGKAAMPPGGSLLDPVQLNPARIRGAVDAADKACAGT